MVLLKIIHKNTRINYCGLFQK